MKEFITARILQGNGLKTKRQEEIETVIVTAVMSLLASFGLIFSFAVITGTDIYSWNPVIAVILYFIFSGIIWGVLIIKNH